MRLVIYCFCSFGLIENIDAIGASSDGKSGSEFECFDGQVIDWKFIYSLLAFWFAHLILNDYVGCCSENIAVYCHVMQSTKIQVFPAEDDRGDWLVFIIILKEEQFLENYWFFSDWQVVDFATAVEEADGDE